MLTQVDHIIVAVARDEQPELSRRLKAAGFVHGDAGKHEGGTANENVAFAGGGFLELLYEQEDGSGPAVWYEETPRVQAIGFGTDEYESDITTWAGAEGSWDHDFTKALDSGGTLRMRAGGPIPRDEFYVFYMRRIRPSYDVSQATARLTEVRFAGKQAEFWRERLASWFRLPGDGADLHSPEGVRFCFQDGPHPRVRLSLAFDVQSGEGTIPLAGGTIELRRATERT